MATANLIRHACDYFEFTHPRRSPTAPQIAAILRNAPAAIRRVTVMRGEAGVEFTRSMQPGTWRVGIAPGGGHTIRCKLSRACDLANAAELRKAIAAGQRPPGTL